MAGAQLDQLRFVLEAALDGPRTACVEVAPLGRVGRAGHVALKYDSPTFLFDLRVWDGDGG